MKTRIEYTGKVPAKKNSYRINPRTRRLYKPADIQRFETDVYNTVREQGCTAIAGKFAISGVFYITNGQDMDNALTSTLDALQIAGVIENDKYLVIIDSLMKVTAGKMRGFDLTIRAVI